MNADLACRLKQAPGITRAVHATHPDETSIQQVLESARPWSRSIHALLASDPHGHQQHRAMGLGPADLATLISRSLPEPEGVLLIANQRNRLSGLAALQPELWPSALLGHRMWTFSHLILSPSCQQGLPPRLVDRACAALDGQADFLAAHPPAADAAAVRGLKRAGFRVVGGEVFSVCRNLDVASPRMSSMDFCSLGSGRQQVVSSLVRACCNCLPFSLDPAFDRTRLADMMRRRMATCLKDNVCDTVAAVNRQGKLLGLAGYSLDTRLEAYLGRQVARLDFLGVSPRHRGESIGALLLQHILAQLNRRGIEAMVARTVMHGTSALSELAALHKLGFATAGTNLIMHHWMASGTGVQAPPAIPLTKRRMAAFTSTGCSTETR